MDPVVTFQRPDRESHRVPAIFVPVQRTRTRPKIRYRALLQSASDVDVARREGLPVYLLTPEIVSAFHYPIRFPPRLIIARDVSPAVDTAFRRIEFARREAAASPRFEDIVVAMLHVDPLAARALAKRNLELVDPDRLLLRVIEENVVRGATLVRLQEVASAIPVEGESISLEALRQHDSNNLVVGVRA